MDPKAEEEMSELSVVRQLKKSKLLREKSSRENLQEEGNIIQVMRQRRASI